MNKKELKMTSVKTQAKIDLNNPSKNLWGHILRFGRVKKNECQFPITFSSYNQALRLRKDLEKLKGKSMHEVQQEASALYFKYKKFNYKG